MTGTDAPHEQWEELVAGHVLGALEPDEEQKLLDHLAHCDQCTRLAADYQRTVADLAYLSNDTEAPPQLWNRIHAALNDPSTDRASAATVQTAATAGGHARSQPAASTPTLGRSAPRRGRAASRLLHRAAGHRRHALAAAAAIAVVVGVGSWQAVDQLGGSSHPPSLAAGCIRSAGCQLVQLTGHNANAELLIRGDHVQVVPTGLSSLQAGKTYVLWQLPHDGPPTGVVAFRVTGPPDAIAVQAALPLSLQETTAFALSRETGATIPTHPSASIATGNPST